MYSTTVVQFIGESFELIQESWYICLKSTFKNIQPFTLLLKFGILVIMVYLKFNKISIIIVAQ